MQLLRFQPARLDDAETLSSVAFVSKAFWGYDAASMELWRPELTLTADYILENQVVVAFYGDLMVGFFAVVESDGFLEIDHLWLLPSMLRKGFGSEMFACARDIIARRGHERFRLVAEPNAIGFYEKMGGKPVGSFESSIKGRFLQIYEFGTHDGLPRSN